MKTLYYIGVFVLLGLVSSCVEPMEPNPEYDPLSNTVNATSVINISPFRKAADTRTKQSAADVQYDGTFRDIGNISLYALIQKDGEAFADGQILKQVQEGTQASGYFKPSSSISRSVSTFKVSFPVGTNTLLFYGEAVPGSSTDPLNAYGALGSTFHRQNLWEIGCWARQRLEETKDGEGHLTGKAADFQEIENIILCVLNHMLKIGFNGGNKWDPELTGKVGDKNSLDMTGVELHWADYKSCLTKRSDGTYIFNKSPLKKKNGDPYDLTPLEITLSYTYQELTAIEANALCAGGGPDVLRMVQALYSMLNDAYTSNTNPSVDQEKVARLLMGNIIEYIGHFFKVTGNHVDGWLDEVEGNNVNTIVTALNDYVLAPANAMDADRDFGNYSIHQFPTCFDMPAGAASMKWSDSEGFYYVTEISDLFDGSTLRIYDFTYPPSLVYYGNAPVRITYGDITEDSFPNNNASWVDDGEWSTRGWSSGYNHLMPTSSGIAMAYNIGYGNALMETTVRFKDKVLYDNNAAGNSLEQPNAFNLESDPGIGLTLTGILIGGQPDLVDFTYLPTSTDGNRNNRTIYDKYMCAKDPETGEELSTYDAATGQYLLPIPTDQPAQPVYTSVFDNYNPTGRQSDQREVNVALELRNDLGRDFWGETSVVRSGATFYLVGKLNLSDAKKTAEGGYDGISWPAEGDPQIPPYDPETGKTREIVRVFMQGHVTHVTFSIDRNSLKYAKVTAPNLRSSNLTLGLYVDYYWQTDKDIPFEYVVLGAQ